MYSRLSGAESELVDQERSRENNVVGFVPVCSRVTPRLSHRMRTGHPVGLSVPRNEKRVVDLVCADGRRGHVRDEFLPDHDVAKLVFIPWWNAVAVAKLACRAEGGGDWGYVSR